MANQRNRETGGGNTTETRAFVITTIASTRTWFLVVVVQFSWIMQAFISAQEFQTFI